MFYFDVNELHTCEHFHPPGAPLSRQSVPNSPTLRELPRPGIQRNLSDLGSRFKKHVAYKMCDTTPVGLAPPYDLACRARASILKKPSMSSLDGRHPNIPEVAEPDYACASSNGGSSTSRRPRLVKQACSRFGADSVSSDYSADSQTDVDFYRCSSSNSNASDTDDQGNDESDMLLVVRSADEQPNDGPPGLEHDDFRLDEDSRSALLQLDVMKLRKSNS